jgi:hypothetical protein
MPYTFGCRSKSRFVPPITKTLNLQKDYLLSGKPVVIKLLPEEGYAGQYECSVNPGTFLITVNYNDEDESKFPARIKAACIALCKEGFRGTFKISCIAGQIVIQRLETKPLIVDEELAKARISLSKIGYEADVSAQEFNDYMTGDIFSEDKTTLQDVLGSEFLMVHEVAEVSELKKMGKVITKRVIVDSPKNVIYTAHFKAMELELDCALQKKDYSWAETRLRQHKSSVLDNDPNLPEGLRPRGNAICEKFCKLLEARTRCLFVSKK